MTLTPLDKDAVRAAAEAAVNDRIARIDAIAAAQQKVVAAETADAAARAAADATIKEAEAAKRASAKNVAQCKDAVTTALRSALDGGWTAAQLREMGLTVPTSVIASTRPTAPTAGKKKAAARPRLGAIRAVGNTGTDTADAESDHTTAPPIDHGDDAAQSPELAHTGQGAQ